MKISNEINIRRPLSAGNFQRVLKRNKAVIIGVLVLIVFFGAAIFADQIAPYDPQKTSSETFQSPSQKFLFGTD